MCVGNHFCQAVVRCHTILHLQRAGFTSASLLGPARIEVPKHSLTGPSAPSNKFEENFFGFVHTINYNLTILESRIYNVTSQ